MKKLFFAAVTMASLAVFSANAWANDGMHGGQTRFAVAQNGAGEVIPIAHYGHPGPHGVYAAPYPYYSYYRRPPVVIAPVPVPVVPPPAYYRYNDYYRVYPAPCDHGTTLYYRGNNLSFGVQF